MIFAWSNGPSGRPAEVKTTITSGCKTPRPSSLAHVANQTELSRGTRSNSRQSRFVTDSESKLTIRNYIHTSDGKTVDWLGLEDEYERLRREQRKLSRKNEGSIPFSTVLITTNTQLKILIFIYVF
jgi:hypothetical protein